MKLYLGDGRFYCRQCLGLSYKSTRQPEWLNACDKAWKLCGNLGPDVNPMLLSNRSMLPLLKDPDTCTGTPITAQRPDNDLYYSGMRVFLKMPVADVEEDC